MKLTTPRKIHRCHLCCDPIKVGEPCGRYSGLEPGEGWFTTYLHPICERFTRSWGSMEWEIYAGDLTRREVALWEERLLRGGARGDEIVSEWEDGE